MTHRLPDAGGNTGNTVLDKIRAVIPEGRREDFYRVVTAVATGLLAFGFLDDQKAALWTQLGLALVTTLFALLYATSQWRVALYSITGPVGAVLMGYGIVSDTRWALIAAAVAQLFGMATAAAKTVQKDYELVG
ncbi:membrane protein [Gordonia phage CaiB]|nr:membrane protein [Gordonia phage AnarQue]UOW93000.1 membrane protein [Gordonia phage CaiB]